MNTAPPVVPVPRRSNGMILPGFSLNPRGLPKGTKHTRPRRTPKRLLEQLFAEYPKGIDAVHAAFAAMLRDRNQRGSAIKLVGRYAPHLLMRAIEQHFLGADRSQTKSGE